MLWTYKLRVKPNISNQNCALFLATNVYSNHEVWIQLWFQWRMKLSFERQLLRMEYSEVYFQTKRDVRQMKRPHLCFCFRKLRMSHYISMKIRIYFRILISSWRSAHLPITICFSYVSCKMICNTCSFKIIFGQSNQHYTFTLSLSAPLIHFICDLCATISISTTKSNVLQFLCVWFSRVHLIAVFFFVYVLVFSMVQFARDQVNKKYLS